MLIDTYSGDRVVEGVGLQPPDYWNCGFEYRRGHGCSSLVFVVCCVGRSLCDELITRAENYDVVCVCVCVCGVCMSVCVCVYGVCV